MNSAVIAIAGGIGTGMSMLGQGVVTAAAGAFIVGALSYLLQVHPLWRARTDAVRAAKAVGAMS
jgi:hypothetical protein